MSHSLESSITVSLTPREAFALAHTLGVDRTAWDTALTRRMLLRDAFDTKEGTHVFERFDNGLRLILVYDLVVPCELSSNQLVKGPWWLKRYGEGLRFVKSGGGTKVTWKIAFEHSSSLFGHQSEKLVGLRMQHQLQERIEAYQAASLDSQLVARAVSGGIPDQGRHRDS